MPEGDAIRKASRYNLDLEEGRNPVAERSRREMTVAEFARDVWLKKKATEVRPKSLARYRSVAENFVGYLEKVRKLKAPLLGVIGYDIASDYLAHRVSTPLMGNGQKKFTRAMRKGAAKKTVLFDRETLFQLFDEAVRRDLIRKNPFSDIHPPKPTIHEVRAVHHPLTIEEEDALLLAAKELDRDGTDSGGMCFHNIVLFLVKTGLREDELSTLEWSDIDWKDGLIHIKEKFVEETRIVPIPPLIIAPIKKLMAGKSPDDPLFTDDDVEAFAGRLHIRGKAEMLSIKVGEVDLTSLNIVAKRSYTWRPKGTNGAVPMCAAVRNLLERMLVQKTTNFIFAHSDGGPCRMKLLPLLKKAQKLAGIGGRLRIHDLRHTLGRRLRKDFGVPLETIMGILRHADIRETMIYAPYSLEEGQSAMSKLDAMSPAAPSLKP